MNQATSLADALRASIRQRREHHHGWPREELAAKARELGLASWTADTVINVEKGARALSVEEFLLLAPLLGVELADLLPNSGWLSLKEESRVRAKAARAILQGHARDVRRRDVGTGAPLVTKQAAQQFASDVRALAARAERLAPGLTLGELEQAEEAAATGLAERKAGARLQASPLDVSIAAFERWGRSLTEERDRRLEAQSRKLKAQSRKQLTPRSIQALRGHITRDLIEELEPIIRRGEERNGGQEE